jgi:hypothetical protein
LAAEAGVDGIIISNHGGEHSTLSFCVDIVFDIVILLRPSIRIVSRRDDHCHLKTANERCSSLPSIDVLYRLRKERPDVFDKVEGQSYVNGDPPSWLHF